MCLNKGIWLLFKMSLIMDLIICFCWVAFTDPVESYFLLGGRRGRKVFGGVNH